MNGSVEYFNIQSEVKWNIIYIGTVFSFKQQKDNNNLRAAYVKLVKRGIDNTEHAWFWLEM